MARSNSDPLRVVPMKIAPESLPLVERLKLLKQLAMNSSQPKRMVLQREQPPHIRHSPSVATASIDELIIETSRGKARCKSPFLASKLSVFPALANNRVSKIA
jgi:hypothetical protein